MEEIEQKITSNIAQRQKMSNNAIPPVEDPPIYYCWKYWTADGQIREGCTSIEPKEDWPDLNEYGWIYIAGPLLGLFILVAVVGLICSRKGNSKSQKQSILIESDDSDDEPPPRSKYSRVQSYPGQQVVNMVPVRRSKTEDFYTVVQMANAENASAPYTAVSPRGGVAQPVQHGQRKLYPKLSTVRQVREEEVVGVNGKRYNKQPVHTISPHINQYVNSPLAARQNSKARKQTKVIENVESSSEDDLTDNELHSETEDENMKEN